MVCYVPGIGTLAGIGLAAYLIWHKAIGHFLSAVGVVLEFALIIGGAAAAVVVLTWTARMIQQRRARAGACTTCRFRCQQSIRPRPHLLVNRVDRRLAPVPGKSSVAYDGYVLTPDGVDSRPGTGSGLREYAGERVDVAAIAAPLAQQPVLGSPEEVGPRG